MRQAIRRYISDTPKSRVEKSVCHQLHEGTLGAVGRNGDPDRILYPIYRHLFIPDLSALARTPRWAHGLGTMTIMHLTSRLADAVFATDLRRRNPGLLLPQQRNELLFRKP
jgi:hypothetical protein